MTGRSGRNAKSPVAIAAPDRRALTRLVRFVATSGSVGVAAVRDGTVSLSDGTGAPRAFAEHLLAQAASLGLVERRGVAVVATPQARAYLRRALTPGDDAFQDQHRDTGAATIATDDGRRTVRINHAESPLAAMARLKEKAGGGFLPADALAAGERLHADFTRAHLQPRVTMSYEPRLSSATKGRAGGGDLNDSALSARLRVTAAIQAMGPELSGVALDICCFQKGLELVERERQWPARSAKLMLRAALMTLARHYAPPPSTPGRSRAWGGEGYRPGKEAWSEGE